MFLTFPKQTCSSSLVHGIRQKQLPGALLQIRIGYTWPPGAFTNDQRDADKENLAAFYLGAARLLSSGHGGYLPLWARVCNWSSRVSPSSLSFSSGTLMPSHVKVTDAKLKLGGVRWARDEREWTREKITLVLKALSSSCAARVHLTIIIIRGCYHHPSLNPDCPISFLYLPLFR